MRGFGDLTSTTPHLFQEHILYHRGNDAPGQKGPASR
jgi:hypothetical protein